MAVSFWFRDAPDDTNGHSVRNVAQDLGNHPYSAGQQERAQNSVAHDPDRADLDALRAGHAPAFEAIFRRYYLRLVQAAFGYVRSREVAEEIVQDIFLRVWDRRAQLQITGTVAAYLYTAVRYESHKRLKRDAREQRWIDRERSTDPAPLAEDDAYSHPHTDALDRALMQTMQTLPARCREIFQLYREHDLSAVEIAAVLGIAPATVRVQLARAMRELRESIAALQGSEQG